MSECSEFLPAINKAFKKVLHLTGLPLRESWKQYKGEKKGPTESPALMSDSFFHHQMTNYCTDLHEAALNLTRSMFLSVCTCVGVCVCSGPQSHNPTV